MKNEIIKSNVPRMSIAAFRTEGHKAGPIAVLHYHDEMEFLPVYSGTFCCVVDEKTSSTRAFRTRPSAPRRGRRPASFSSV